LNKIYHFTRIVDNRRKGKHNVTIGELVFKNGILSYVILKGGEVDAKTSLYLCGDHIASIHPVQ
jgi:hypothetical protein